MRDLIAATGFYILSVLLFPVTLLGYFIWTGSLLVSRGSGVSATAQGPLSAPWFEHNLGTRSDEPADRLMMVLPGVPRLGPRLVAGPLLLADRLTGYVPKAFRLSGSRSSTPLSRAWCGEPRAEQCAVHEDPKKSAS